MTTHAQSEELQCAARLFDRRSKSTMTCTKPRGHEQIDGHQAKVHEMFLNGKWLGGWVDRAFGKGDEWRQLPPLDLPDEPAVEDSRQCTMFEPAHPITATKEEGNG